MTTLLEHVFAAQVLSLEVGEITIDEAIETLGIMGVSPTEALHRLTSATADEAIASTRSDIVAL